MLLERAAGLGHIKKRLLILLNMHQVKISFSFLLLVSTSGNLINLKPLRGLLINYFFRTGLVPSSNHAKILGNTKLTWAVDRAKSWGQNFICTFFAQTGSLSVDILNSMTHLKIVLSVYWW